MRGAALRSQGVLVGDDGMNLLITVDLNDGFDIIWETFLCTLKLYLLDRLMEDLENIGSLENLDELPLQKWN